MQLKGDTVKIFVNLVLNTRHESVVENCVIEKKYDVTKYL